MEVRLLPFPLSILRTGLHGHGKPLGSTLQNVAMPRSEAYFLQSGQGLVLAFSPLHGPSSQGVLEDGFVTSLSLDYSNCKLVCIHIPSFISESLVLSEPTWRLRFLENPMAPSAMEFSEVEVCWVSWIPFPGSGKTSDPVSRLNSPAILDLSW